MIAADWDPDAYRDQPVLRYQEHGENQTIPLTEIGLSVSDATPDTVTLELRTDERTYGITYALNAAQYFAPTDNNADELVVEDGRESLGLIDYLNSNPITLYTAEFSSIRGAEIFRTDPTNFQPFDQTKLLPMDLDWRQYPARVLDRQQPPRRTLNPRTPLAVPRQHRHAGHSL